MAPPIGDTAAAAAGWERLAEACQDLSTPLALVDLDIVQTNCDRMIAKCEKLGVHLRPHMKTHKTLEIGKMMTGGSKRSIAVSTVKEAEFFADGGFDDILYACVFATDKIERLDALCQQLEQFHVLIDSEVTASKLLDHPRSDGKSWSVFMKLDCGNKRTGLPWDSKEALSLARFVANHSGLTLLGVYMHEGNSYNVRGEQQVQAIGNDTADKALQFKELLEHHGINAVTFAVGATPSCSLPGELMSKMDEFHPGNYVFYDCCQAMIGSCRQSDIAISVATRIIGHYPERGELAVDCGWTALSLDGHGALSGGSYCLIQGHPELSLYKMTQEIGLIRSANEDEPLPYDSLPIGTMLFLLPHHSCATACMHGKYYVHSGSKIVHEWTPCRGW